MSLTTREGAEAYARRLAELIGLRDWHVDVLDDTPAEQLTASAFCVYGRKVVEIRLADAFFRQSPEGQRSTVTHELIHCHFAAMHHYLHRTLGDDQWEGYKLGMEYGVDAVAETLALHLPLPLVTKKGR